MERVVGVAESVTFAPLVDNQWRSDARPEGLFVIEEGFDPNVFGPEIGQSVLLVLEELAGLKSFDEINVSSLLSRIEGRENSAIMFDILGQLSVDNSFADKLIAGADTNYAVLIPSIARKAVATGRVREIQNFIEAKGDSLLESAFYDEVANSYLQLYLAGLNGGQKLPMRSLKYCEELIRKLPQNRSYDVPIGE